MNRVVFRALLLALCLSGCSSIPSTGPLREQLLDQARSGDRFEVIKVDRRVVDMLSAQPQPHFRERFKKYLPPPELPIAVGDVLSVTVWESSADGLFGRSLDAERLPVQELIERTKAAGEPLPAGGHRGYGDVAAHLKMTALGQSLLQQIKPTGRSGAQIPDQRVGPDGAISIPYAGRIEAAGHTPTEAQHLVEGRLAGRALDPQALVVVKKSDVNSVTVTGEAIKGARVPLAPGGARLLDVIAAAGGPIPPPPTTPAPAPAPTVTAITLPVTQLWGTPGTTLGIPVAPAVPNATAPPASVAALHDTIVELSRDGVTASIPYAALVAEPEEDIFAEPGDVLTLIRRPQVISVFGATGNNSAVTFTAERVSLNEVLARSGGLADTAADPQAVFLLRYEPAATVGALRAPIPPSARDGVVPIAYRLDLSDAGSYGLAQRFPVRDKDIIYVADAATMPIQKLFTVIQTLTGPILNGLVSCGGMRC
jgi:polysaccharide export outer membrane protein